MVILCLVWVMQVIEYLEQNKKFLKTFLFCAFLILFLGSFSALEVQATTTKEQLDEAREQEESKKEEIEQNQQDLESLNEAKENISNQLQDYNSKLAEASNKLSETEEAIRDKQEEIDKKLADLEIAREIEQKQYDDMLSHIQYMYENDFGKSHILVLLTSENFSDFLNLAEYIEAVASYNEEVFEDYQTTRKIIEAEEAKLQEEYEVLEELREEQEADKMLVDSLVSKTQSSLTNTQSEIVNKENELTAQEEELAQIQDNVEELQKKFAEELALSEAAAKGEWRDISELSFSPGDEAMIANIVYCEARGESYAGQLAVASVVINRVLSGSYPDTVSGVIYQPYQFAPVASTKNSFVEALAADKAANSAGCYQAAREAMAGITNVENSLYFQTIAYLEAVDRLHVVRFVIGNHGFY